MKILLIVTAIIEAGAGLALLAVPSITGSLLLGMPLDSPAAVSLARVGGAAIAALAIVCWRARRDAQSPASRDLIVAMLFYNFAVAAVLALADFVDEQHGVLLWPAVLFHLTMGAWCIASLQRKDQGVLR
jgi:Kef-type K+ transport system membrane component KefB